MTELQSTVQRRILCAASFLRRGFVACVFTGLVAMAAPAQEVTVTLLPSHTSTEPATPGGYLKVTDSNANYEGRPLGRTASWLYFDASALPKDNEISITGAQLQLVRKTGEGLNRGMVIRVLSAAASPSGGAAQSNYKDGVEVARLQSDRRKCSDDAKCSDSAKWSAKPPEQPSLTGLLQKGDKGVRYIGLLLIPSDESASSRVYYGLRSNEKGEGKDSEARYQPRLILTYRYNSQPSFGCTSEPLALAKLSNTQSEGGAARISGCEFITKENRPRQDNYAPLKVADDSLTVTPVVYGDLIFVVRNNKWSECPGPDIEKPQPEAVCLEARKALGGVVWKAWVDAKGNVPERSRMVVNRFGLLRIITGDAIYSFQLTSKQTCPGPRIKTTVDFKTPPAEAVEGPDGTLYLVSTGVFALNPDNAPVDTDLHPRKLWRITLGNAADADARITLGPDGQFLYVLAFFSDESKFLAINAQTGKDVDLIHEVANPKFPANLRPLYNPVVAKHEDGADYVFIAGNLGTRGVLWGIKNKPAMTQDGDYTAKVTKAWIDEIDAKIGQPILDPIANGAPDLSAKKLYFLVSGPTSELRAVGALDGKTVNASNSSVTCTVDTILDQSSLTCKEYLPQLSNVSAYYFPTSPQYVPKKVNTCETQDLEKCTGGARFGNLIGYKEVLASGPPGATVVWGIPPNPRPAQGGMPISPVLDYTEVGQQIKIGSRQCTVIAKTKVCGVLDPCNPGGWSPDEYSLTCNENLGQQSNVEADVPWARVNTSGHVVRLVDAQSDGTKSPNRTRSGYPFSLFGFPPGPTMRIGPETQVPANISADGNPVMDSAGNLMFWADDTFYGFTGGLIPLFNRKLSELGNPQLLFGPGGTLYAASGATVSALIPSFNLDTLGNDRKIKSPTSMQVTGTATTGAPWELEARGSVIHGNEFQVQDGATLSVKVPGEPPSLGALGQIPCACAEVNRSALGTMVTSIRGQNFDKTVVGQQILIGSTISGLHLCTVATKTSNTSLTCKENLGDQPIGSTFSNSPAVVKTDGTDVDWISGAPFATLLADGDRGFFIGFRRCTLARPLVSRFRLRCNEDQGKSDRILAYRVDGTVSGSPVLPSTPDNVCK